MVGDGIVCALRRDGLQLSHDKPDFDDDEELELAFPCPHALSEALGKNYAADLKARELA